MATNPGECAPLPTDLRDRMVKVWIDILVDDYRRQHDLTEPSTEHDHSDLRPQIH